MELAQDVPLIDNRFDLIDLLFAVDCCVLLNSGRKGDTFNGTFVMMSNSNYEAINHSYIRAEHPPMCMEKRACTTDGTIFW